MAKSIKLTDEVYQSLKDLARADGETIAGEIRQIIAFRKIMHSTITLEKIANKLTYAKDKLSELGKIGG